MTQRRDLSALLESRVMALQSAVLPLFIRKLFYMIVSLAIPAVLITDASGFKGTPGLCLPSSEKDVMRYY